MTAADSLDAARWAMLRLFVIAVYRPTRRLVAALDARMRP